MSSNRVLPTFWQDEVVRTSESPVEYNYSIRSLMNVLHFSSKCPSPHRSWLEARLIWPNWFHKSWDRSDRQAIRSTIWVLWAMEYHLHIRTNFTWFDLQDWRRVACTICKLLRIRAKSTNCGHTGPNKPSGNRTGSSRSRKRLENFLHRKRRLDRPIEYPYGTRVDAYVPPHRRTEVPPPVLRPDICPTCKGEMTISAQKARMLPREDFNAAVSALGRTENVPGWYTYTPKYVLVHSGRVTGQELRTKYPGFFTDHECEEADVAYNLSHPYECLKCTYDFDLFD